MINLIYGAKGSGKTKRIIDAANEKAKTAKGAVVFITDNDRSLDVEQPVRFVNVKDYNIKWDCCLGAFIKGMIAANSDNDSIFIDGVSRILGKAPDELEELMKELEGVSTSLDVDVTLTVSTDKLPKFMLKYV